MKVYCLSDEASLHTVLGPWRILKLKYGEIPGDLPEIFKKSHSIYFDKKPVTKRRSGYEQET